MEKKLFSSRAIKYMRGSCDFENVDIDKLESLCYVPNVDDSERPQREVDQLLKAVFARNPHTHLPANDYAKYLDSKTSPEIRTYIASQLLTSHPAPVDVPEGIDEDTLIEFTRRSDEDKYAYIERLQSYISKDNGSTTKSE